MNTTTAWGNVPNDFSEEEARLCCRRVKKLEDCLDGANINTIKVVWAFTLGYVTEVRNKRGETNFDVQCRNQYEQLHASDVAIVERGPRVYCSDELNQEAILLRSNAYRNRIFTLIRWHATHWLDALNSVIKAAKKICKMTEDRTSLLFAISNRHDRLRHSLLMNSSRAMQARWLRLALASRDANNDHIPVAYGTRQRKRKVAELLKQQPQQPQRQFSELNFPFHGQLCPEAWARSATETPTCMGGRQLFCFTAWECCPPTALNLLLAQLYSLPAYRAPRRGAYEAAKKQMIVLLHNWFEAHFDTKNLVLVVSYGLGLTANRMPEILESFPLSILCLFSHEEDPEGKEVIEAYRGEKPKIRLLSLLSTQILPLLPARGLVNVYNFAHELRSSLAQHYVSTFAARSLFGSLCAYARKEKSVQGDFESAFYEATGRQLRASWIRPQSNL